MRILIDLGLGRIVEHVQKNIGSLQYGAVRKSSNVMKMEVDMPCVGCSRSSSHQSVSLISCASHKHADTCKTFSIQTETSAPFIRHGVPNTPDPSISIAYNILLVLRTRKYLGSCKEPPQQMNIQILQGNEALARDKNNGSVGMQRNTFLYEANRRAETQNSEPLH